MKKLLALILLSSFILSCQQPNSEGQKIYESKCANCHQIDGSGLGELIPNLTTSNYFDNPSSELVCLILNGKENSDPEAGKELQMPPTTLSEVELTNLINYLEQKFSKGQSISLVSVKKSISTCN